MRVANGDLRITFACARKNILKIDRIPMSSSMFASNPPPLDFPQFATYFIHKLYPVFEEYKKATDSLFAFATASTSQ